MKDNGDSISVVKLFEIHKQKSSIPKHVYFTSEILLDHMLYCNEKCDIHIEDQEQCVYMIDSYPLYILITTKTIYAHSSVRRQTYGREAIAFNLLASKPSNFYTVYYVDSLPICNMRSCSIKDGHLYINDMIFVSAYSMDDWVLLEHAEQVINMLVAANQPISVTVSAKPHLLKIHPEIGDDPLSSISNNGLSLISVYYDNSESVFSGKTAKENHKQELQFGDMTQEDHVFFMRFRKYALSMNHYYFNIAENKLSYFYRNHSLFGEISTAGVASPYLLVYNNKIITGLPWNFWAYSEYTAILDSIYGGTQKEGRKYIDDIAANIGKMDIRDYVTLLNDTKDGKSLNRKRYEKMSKSRRIDTSINRIIIYILNGLILAGLFWIFAHK